MSTAFSVKWILGFSLIGSAFAVLSFGIMNSIIGILLSRLILGFCSNTQPALHRFLNALSLVQKTEWQEQSRKALYAYKFGTIVGVGICIFLSNPVDFLSKDSKFVARPYLLSSLIIFFLQISGILLVFSIESSGTSAEPKQYIELPEVKEGEKKDLEDAPKKTDHEQFELQSYLQSSGLANEHVASEESVGPEDFKFYSPRNVVNKMANERVINSARPKAHSSFSFAGSASETKDHIVHEGEGKRTHISFIEDEFESMEEVVEHVENEQPVQREVPVNHLAFAEKFRIFSSFFTGLLVESLPYWLIVNYNVGVYYYGGVLFSAYFLSTGVILITQGVVLQKYSYCSIVKISLIVQTIFLVSLPLLASVKFVPVIAVVLIAGNLITNETYASAGCVMISDSVNLSLREQTIGKNNLACIAAKAAGSAIGPVLLVTIGNQCSGYILIAFGVFALFWQSKKISTYFPCMDMFPYKL